MILRLRGECRGATDDNSPAFQRRVEAAKIPSPAGTTGLSVIKNGIAKPCGIRSAVPAGLVAVAGTPALKRRAIVGLSLPGRKTAEAFGHDAAGGGHIFKICVEAV